MTSPTVYRGLNLHIGQRQIVNDIFKNNTFYNIINTPRQFGKSTLLMQLVLYNAINNKNSISMITSPIYAQAKKIYKELVRAIERSGVIASKDNSDFTLTLINGSIIYFKSVKIPDNIRGYAIDFMYNDEAATYRENTFNEVLRPMLTVRGKKCYLFSTPKGKNYFYKMAQLAKTNERYSYYLGSSDDNPYANREEIEEARKTLPKSIFEQEYLAVFAEDGGEVFTNLKNCSVLNQYPAYNPNIKYHAGLDIGKQDDSTVLTILGEDNKIYHILKINKVDWGTIVNEVAKVLKKFNPKETLVEINGLGDPIYELLSKQYKNITPWLTTNDSKQQIIEELILAFQEQKLSIPTDKLFPDLYDELCDFSFKYSTKSRKIIYGARTGHDDCVLSLALSAHSKKMCATKGQYYVM